MRRQCQVEKIGGKNVNRRPARERYQQAEQTADGKEYDRHHGIRLDKGFRVAADLQAGIGAYPMRKCRCHVLPPLFHHVNTANHLMMADTTKFVTHDAVHPGLVRRYRQHHFVIGVNLDIDVCGLQREAM